MDENSLTCVLRKNEICTFGIAEEISASLLYSTVDLFLIVIIE